ncbi:hypothetical protein AB9128_14260 [Streptomyces cinereoruber]|uniref:hypothetical protein n=1 Tax=Streptomyces cinereoruber TaxID=67260 RepID=UPI003EC0D845
MGRHVVRRSTAGGLALLAGLTAGCTSEAEPPRSDGTVTVRTTPAPAPVVSTAEAAKVFEEYDRVNAAADASLDGSAIARVQTGVLLKESLAAYDIHRKAKTTDTATRFARPRFLIPAVDPARPYPRSFAVLSKRKGNEDDRSSLLFYFTRAKAGEPWKATAETWALTEPFASPSPSSSDAAPTASASQDDKTVQLRPKRLPELERGPSGTTPSSPTATADRAVCDGFADLLSFSPPHGSTEDARFTRGAFTSDLVRRLNGRADRALERRWSYRTTGEDLPVFRLAHGGSLVACTYVREYDVAGTGATGTVRFGKGSDTDVLLGGGGREWRSVKETGSMTALIEVPAPKSAPATVLGCDCYAPQAITATGVPAP